MKKDTTQMSDYEKAKFESKEKQRLLMSEEYQVVIKLPSTAHNWRLTYSNKKSNKVVAIEEVTSLEEVINSSTFRGKSCSGFCSADIKELKPLLTIKANQWLTSNPDIWIDEYFKKH
jgi:hypothetical protein